MMADATTTPTAPMAIPIESPRGILKTRNRTTSSSTTTTTPPSSLPSSSSPQPLSSPSSSPPSPYPALAHQVRSRSKSAAVLVDDVARDLVTGEEVPQSPLSGTAYRALHRRHRREEGLAHLEARAERSYDAAVRKLELAAAAAAAAAADDSPLP